MIFIAIVAALCRGWYVGSRPRGKAGRIGVRDKDKDADADGYAVGADALDIIIVSG